MRSPSSYFGTWSGKAAAEAPVPPAARTARPRISSSSTSPARPRPRSSPTASAFPHHPNLQALQVMNYTLGASFGSRINMNLREVHGYTYGANSPTRFTAAVAPSSPVAS